MMRELRTKRLNLRVSQEWYDLVEKAANRNGLSMTDVIMHATERFLLESKPAADIPFVRTKRGRRKDSR